MEEFWHSGGLQIYQLGLACMITNNEWSMGETGPAAVADLQGFEEVIDAKRKSKILWRRLDDLQSLWPRNLFNLMFIQVKGRGRREAINTCCWIFRELGIMQIKWLFLQFLFCFFFGSFVSYQFKKWFTAIHSSVEKRWPSSGSLDLNMGSWRRLLFHLLPAHSSHLPSPTPEGCQCLPHRSLHLSLSKLFLTW